MRVIRQAIARVLCQPIVGRGVLRAHGRQVPCRGLRFDLGRDPDPSVAARLAFGFYEAAEIRFVNRYLRTDLDVIELGGSIGVVASFVGRRLDPGRRLVVVEPVPELISLIRTNVSRNAPNVSFETIHGALDYDVPHGATVPVVVDRDNTRGRVGVRGEQTLDVPVFRLSPELERLGIDDFALICDVEGAEWGLVERDLEALRRCRQVIIELHPPPPPRTGSVAELRDRLLESGRFFERDRDGPVVCLERAD